MTDDVETLSFEKAYQELEATVQKLEEGNLTLEEAISTYERGIHLAQHCGDALDAAELQVQELTLVDDQQQLGMFFEEEVE
jgi:exodeoxyribonuclease VII small subunit